MNPILNQKEFELIELFLEENLDEDQMELIRARIKSDQAFASLVEEIRVLQLGIQSAVIGEKMDLFHADLAEQNEPTPIRSIRPLWFWGVAASLFLVMTACIWWIIGQESPEEKLYQTYFNADPGLVTSMASGGNYEFDRAMVDYKDKNYANAIARWEMLLDEKPQNDTLNYFIGMALLASDQGVASTKYLEIVAQDTSSAFFPDANWYLGLFLIKGKDFDLAKGYLEKSNRTEIEQIFMQMKRDPD